MKLRKILCILLAGIMALSLAGCITDDGDSATGGKDDPQGGDFGQAGEINFDDFIPDDVSDDEIAAFLEEEGMEYVNGFYRFKETRNITVELFDRGLEDGRTEPLESYWTKWLQHKVKEDLNIAVTYVTVPRWSEDVEINNLLASGTAPGIMKTYNYPAILTFAEEMNGIIDLDPFVTGLAFLAPDLWDLLGPDLIYFNRNLTTGQIWAIEGIKIGATRINTFVRGDWLRRLGLDEPTSLEEFEAMLYSFKANAEFLLGDNANQMIPFSMGTDIGWRAAHLLEASVPHNISDKTMFTHGFDDRHFMFPGIVDGVRVLNKWFNEGLLWQEFAFNDDGSIEENLIKSGFVGSFIHNWNYPWRENELGIQGMLRESVGPEAGFTAVMAFQDDAGTYKKFMPANNDRKICFPMTNQEPVASLVYLNYISRQDVRSYLSAGEEGINFELIENGTMARTLDPTEASVRDNIFTAAFTDDTGKNQWTYAELRMNSPANIDYMMTFNSDGAIFYKNDDISRASIALSYPTATPEEINKAVKFTSYDARFKREVNVGSIEAERGMSRTLPQKRNAVLAAAVIASVADFDSVWASGMKDYLDNGGQAIIDERTAKWIAVFGDVENLG